MSRPDELRAVQARVKDATEGGPDLDEAIHAALLPNDPWWQCIVEGRRLVAAGDPEAYVICPPSGPLGGENRMRAVSWAEGAKVGSYSASLDDAKRLVARMLPGFWHSTTTCWRTADADIGPDFTGPLGDDLLAAGWTMEEHDAVTFSAVVAPGGPIHAECLALIAATLKALIAKEGLTPPSPEVLAERRAALAAMKAAPTRSALIAREEDHGR